MKNYRNNPQLALDILRGKWLLHNADSFVPVARSFIERTQTAAVPPAPLAGMAVAITGGSRALDELAGEAPGTEKYVVVIPLRGCLTKYDNCVGTPTMEVADLLDEYRDREDVCAFVLDIDSPGGCSNAVYPVLSAIFRIREAGKPVIAHIDQCCSAAYWIASGCDAIFADNLLSEAGSIGAYYQFVDARAANPSTGEKIVEVYAPQSVDKNKAYRDALDGDTSAAEKELSDLVDVFIKDVKAGRPDLKEDTPGVLSGAVFTTPAAIDAGLVDHQADLDGCIEIAYVRAKENQ